MSITPKEKLRRSTSVGDSTGSAHADSPAAECPIT